MTDDTTDTRTPLQIRMSEMLGLKLYAVISTGTGEDLGPHLEAHIDYMIGLEREGKVFASGPMGERGKGDGLTILRVDTLEEAQAIVDADPFKATGRTTRIEPWTVNEGTVDVTLSFSDRRGEAR